MWRDDLCLLTMPPSWSGRSPPFLTGGFRRRGLSSPAVQWTARPRRVPTVPRRADVRPGRQFLTGGGGRDLWPHRRQSCGQRNDQRSTRRVRNYIGTLTRASIISSPAPPRRSRGHNACGVVDPRRVCKRRPEKRPHRRGARLPSAEGTTVDGRANQPILAIRADGVKPTGVSFSWRSARSRSSVSPRARSGTHTPT